MTGKSQDKNQRTIRQGKGKRKPAASRSRSRVLSASLRKTEAGGIRLSAAERILAECRAGVGPESREQNTCWDDLHAIWVEKSRMLLAHAERLPAVLRDAELLSYVADKATFATNVNQFAGDLKQLNEELRELHALHEGRTGGSDDPQEVLHSIHIAEQYVLWMQRHDGVLMPTVFHILEMTNQAELARAHAQAEDPEHHHT